MCGRWFSVLGTTLSITLGAAAHEPSRPADPKPPCERLLSGRDAARAEEFQKQIDAAEAADRYDDAIRLGEELLTLRTQVQGADHWEVVTTRWALNAARRLAQLPREQRDEWRTALRGVTEAQSLMAQGAFAEAQVLLEAHRRSCEQVFGERHRETASADNVLGTCLSSLAKYEEAGHVLERAMEVRRDLLGDRHPETAISMSNIAQTLDAQGKFLESEPLHRQALEACREALGNRDFRTATCCNNLAFCLSAQAKYGEAQPLFQESLDVIRELKGEDDPYTASAMNNVAYNLAALGEHAEAERLYRQALDLRRRVLGERHADTATAYANLAQELDEQGKHADAWPLHQRALDLRRELLGEMHVDTGGSYNNLAGNLSIRGDHVGAGQLHLKALHIHRTLFGDVHPETARDYFNLAGTLYSQDRHAEAQPLYERSLQLHVLIYTERHTYTILGMRQLARNLAAQERYADAVPLFRKALDLSREVLGETHTGTADSHNDLACILDTLGQYAEALPHHQRALELDTQGWGEQHPATCLCYMDLAGHLCRQGRYAEAQPLLAKSLASLRQRVGDRHQYTTRVLDSLAAILVLQHRYADALPLLRESIASYETARLTFAERGADRALFRAEGSPYLLFTISHIRLGDVKAAWTAAELDLARGLNDELASRNRIALTPEEQARQEEYTTRLHDVQPRILELVARPLLEAEEQSELTRLQAERQSLEDKLSALAVALNQRQLATLREVQASLPADGALVLWIDGDDLAGQMQEHWACVVRSSGDPQWEQLAGRGEGGVWTEEDKSLPQALLNAVAREAPTTEVTELAAKLNAQRLAPLEKHLVGIRRLFVVPVHAMAGVPIEVVTDRCVVSYVPSGTFLARQNERERHAGATLLALGDPVFPFSSPKDDALLPVGGLLITQVLPGGAAERARLIPGDVLLAYAGAKVESLEQLATLILDHAREESVPTSVWRAGDTTERHLSAGSLGVLFDRQLAPTALKTNQLLSQVSRGGDWAELPGTSVEVARLRSLAGDDHTTSLTRYDASEQSLEQLRADGKLKDFRYLHFATHGEPNNARAFESALILAQDQITGEIPKGGGKYYDGRLTANEVLENWELNADLVTLSACESALGRPGGGDGLLGFAQAFLLAGARSVCLSLWKVDDTATALLMDRFYQNLLGKREGLGGPMPKAEALAEAKQWLRNLTQDEANRLWTVMSTNVSRGTGEAAIPLVPADDHPYSHPRYWAAFILIGDPE